MEGTLVIIFKVPLKMVLYFPLDSSNFIDKCFLFHLEIHETVAECMIMANHWVARKIADVFPAFSLLRLHPPPKKVNEEKIS